MKHETNGKYFFKGASAAHAVLVGRVARSEWNEEKDGTAVLLQTVERYAAATGGTGEARREVWIRLAGKAPFEAGAMISVTGDLLLSTAGGGKYPVTYEVIANPVWELLGAAPAELCGMNRALLVGRVGKLRPISAAGKSGLAVSVAVSRTEDGEGRDDVTDWHEAVFWGRRSENASRILGIGDTVMLTGCVACRSVKVDGKLKNLPGFLPDGFTLLHRKAARAGASAAAPAARQAAGAEPLPDDPIPF